MSKLISLLAFLLLYNALPQTEPVPAPVSENSSPAAILQLARYFESKGNTNKALEYYTMAENHYLKVADYEGLGIVYRSLRRMYTQNKEYETAIYYGEKSVTAFEKARDTVELITSLNFLGVRFGDQGLGEKSLEANLRALALCEQSHDSLRTAIQMTNIAGIYATRADVKQCLAYNLKAMSFLETTHDYKAKGYLLNNIGMSYQGDKKYAEAIKCYMQSMDCRRRVGDIQGMVFTLGNIGELYMEQNMLNQASPFIRRAVALSDSIEDPLAQATAYNTQAGYLLRTGKKSDALEYYLKSLALAKSVEFKGQEADNLLKISRVYEEMLNYPEALSYYQRYASLMDTLFQEKSQKAIAEMSEKYKAALSEKTILSLREHDKVKSAVLARNRVMIGSLIAGILVILIASAVTLYFYRQKLEAYTHLVKKDISTLQAEKERSGGNTVQRPVSDEMQEQILANLAELMDGKRRYMDPALTLGDLARELGTNTSYLSRVINDSFSSNFSQFINEFRIREARQMLTNKEFNNLSIEGIARSVGFNSKSAFNAAFKKVTGVTPSFYQVSAKQVLQGGRMAQAEFEGKNYPQKS